MIPKTITNMPARNSKITPTFQHVHFTWPSWQVVLGLAMPELIPSRLLPEEIAGSLQESRTSNCALKFARTCREPDKQLSPNCPLSFASSVSYLPWLTNVKEGVAPLTLLLSAYGTGYDNSNETYNFPCKTCSPHLLVRMACARQKVRCV